MRTNGRFLNKQIWYSICSKHYVYDENCKLCRTGTWTPIWKVHLDSFFWKFFPTLTQKWINRSWESKAKIMNKIKLEE